MKRRLYLTLLVLALSLLVTGVAWADNGQDGAIALLLAPLVAAATAIERIIEMIFDGYESLILNASRAPGEAKNYISWARKEIQKLQTEVLGASGDLVALSEAEKKLDKAKERLEGYLKSPFYTSWKRTISLILGIALGLVIAFSTKLKMFELLDVNLRWDWIDLLVTGLVIGTGSAPVHSLIGILQKTKEAVDQARGLWKGKARREIAEALNELGIQLEGTGRDPQKLSELEFERLSDRLLR